MWGLIGFTIILLITAVILFLQLKKPAAPAPLASPRPKASPTLPTVQQTELENVCEVSFTVTAPASPSPSPSVSPSPSPSPEPITCFDTCNIDSDCEADLKCMTVGGDKRCVNPSCSSETDCVCADASPSPSPSASPHASITPSPSAITYAPPATAPSPPTTITKGGQPELPEAGFIGPAVLGVSAGLLMMLLGLLF